MQDLHILFHSLQQLSRELTKALNEALQPFDIFSSQWSVLYVLKQKGCLTQSQLAEYLAIEAPPMTRTIQKLEQMQYVSREKGEDRRTNYILLTEKALDKYPEWEAAILAKNQQLVNQFPKNSQQQLLHLLQQWQHSIITGRENGE